jgi:hypothetical protein
LTVGETLLKITDYPFVYSITLIILAFNGMDLYSKDVYPYLAAAGFIGTFLAILDPFGRIIKYLIILLQKLHIHLVGNEDNEEWIYVQSAYHTRQIEVEKDKIVSMFYFTLIVAVAINFINASSPAIHHFAFIFNLNPTCNLDCQKTLTIVTLNIIQYTVFGVMGWNAVRLTKKVNIVATYLSCISSPKTSAQPIENISRFIESGDWKTAEYWQKRIHEDIKYNRGQKDLVMKAAEAVFRPLHAESFAISQTHQNIITTRNYSDFRTDTWQKIIIESSYGMIVDTELKKEIEEFYQKIQKYNNLRYAVFIRFTDLIKLTASEIFKTRVNDIRYFVTDRGDRQSAPDILRCVLFQTHPLKTGDDLKPVQLDIVYSDKGDSNTLVLKPNEQDFDKFEEFWTKMIGSAESDNSLQELRTLLHEIEEENKELLKKYEEQIRLQLNV